MNLFARRLDDQFNAVIVAIAVGAAVAAGWNVHAGAAFGPGGPAAATLAQTSTPAPLLVVASR